MSSRRMIFASIATALFVVMMAVAEVQIRSSPNWPPPPKHEVGGWESADPAIWELGAAINLPASALNVWAWQTTDGLTYALDDHQLIIYVSWIPLVFLLWYLVGAHLERVPSRRRNLLLGVQIFITLEMLVLGRAFQNAAAVPLDVALCFWTWIAATLLGWANLVSKVKRSTKDPHQS